MTEKRKRVYLAGKISGTQREDYLKKFADKEEYLFHLGYDVLNPAKMCDTLPVHATRRVYAPYIGTS